MGIKTYLGQTLESSVVVDGGMMNKNYNNRKIDEYPSKRFFAERVIILDSMHDWI